jgi:hypothetical protein
LTSLAFHHCLRPSVLTLAQASPPRGHRSKASNLPFMLAIGPSSQVLSWSSPPYSHDSISCLICNKILHHMCEPCNISKPFHLHGIGCSHMMYLWTNHLCISLKHILVHLRLSLNYQNQTRTFHTPTWADVLRSNDPQTIGTLGPTWSREVPECSSSYRTRPTWPVRPMTTVRRLCQYQTLA